MAKQNFSPLKEGPTLVLEDLMEKQLKPLPQDETLQARMSLVRDAVHRKYWSEGEEGAFVEDLSEDQVVYFLGSKSWMQEYKIIEVDGAKLVEFVGEPSRVKRVYVPDEE